MRGLGSKWKEESKIWVQESRPGWKDVAGVVSKHT